MRIDCVTSKIMVARCSDVLGAKFVTLTSFLFHCCFKEGIHGFCIIDVCEFPSLYYSIIKDQSLRLSGGAKLFQAKTVALGFAVLTRLRNRFRDDRPSKTPIPINITIEIKDQSLLSGDAPPARGRRGSALDA